MSIQSDISNFMSGDKPAVKPEQATRRKQNEERKASDDKFVQALAEAATQIVQSTKNEGPKYDLDEAFDVIASEIGATRFNKEWGRLASIRDALTDMVNDLSSDNVLAMAKAIPPRGRKYGDRQVMRLA